VTDTVLPRTLWYREKREPTRVTQEFLTTDPRSLIVLGEAGMGKSTLLRQLLDHDGYEACTARALINAPETQTRFGHASTLVIDALDEVPAQNEGDAVDRVVRKLAALGYPRFILSCRIADWRSATALQVLSDLYSEPPLELHIEPLDRGDAVTFLSASLGNDRGEEVARYLESHGLSGLWSNPQTLNLVEQVASEDRLPDSKGELFAQATKLLSREHREEKASARLTTLPQDVILDAAGAAFAALILTGNEAVSTRATPASHDLALAEIIGLTDGAPVEAILGSRLFAALDPDRFTYTHRAIGEFLGARWLARSADTDRKRQRILQLFNTHALVPASLRGMFAWLAWHGGEIGSAVIAADPMAVVQYGDADRLSVTQARDLLDALSRVAKENPRFRAWTEYRVGGLAQPALLPQIIALIEDPETELGLKLLLLQALKGSTLTAALAATLEALLLDPSQAFANRSEAGDRLIESSTPLDWPGIVGAIRAQGDEDGVRLAIELMDALGYHGFNDSLLLEVVLAQLDRSEHMVGVFRNLERNVGQDRLDALLDGISAAARGINKYDERPEYNALTDLANSLLTRRIPADELSPERLWSWLEPFDIHYGFRREAREAVALLLQQNVGLKRAVQHYVLFQQSNEKSVWDRSWRLTQRSSGLHFEDGDVVALLDSRETGDPCWRDLVRLVRHSETEGTAVRLAAARFATADADGDQWLAELTIPRVAEWEVKEEARQREQRTKRERDWAKHRAEFSERIDAMRAGDYGLIINPAKAYLKLFSDMGDDATDGPSRIEEWLGADLRDASLAGFEAFLTIDPPRPDATELANSYADSRRWDAAYVIVAALAERCRTGVGFDDLPAERLMAGLIELRHSRIDDHAGIGELDQLLAEALRERGAWEDALRIYFEPQFANRRSHVSGLYALLREPRDTALAIKLSLEWLGRYPDMGEVPEAELLGFLIASPVGRTALGPLALERRIGPELSDERRRNWDAVGLLVNFEATRAALEAAGPIEPELFWHVRARTSDHRDERTELGLATAQLIWMIETFRGAYPLEPRPNSVFSGDKNPWDASEFLQALINRLGDETSDEAIESLTALRDAPHDGYSELMRVAAAEQKRKRVEADWCAPDLVTVASAVLDCAPTTAAQLQAVILDELARVQRQLRGSDVDWYRDFFTGRAPRGEEDCRDSLLKMLRPLPFDIQALPEGHVADDKRCDILCLLGDTMVPIEIKGQWHASLWTAADDQLDRLYVNDWRAERGIYLILWFGSGSPKKLKAPPRGVARPASAEELRDALTQRSATTRDGRVDVVVLDLERAD